MSPVASARGERSPRGFIFCLLCESEFQQPTVKIQEKSRINKFGQAIQKRNFGRECFYLVPLSTLFLFVFSGKKVFIPSRIHLFGFYILFRNINYYFFLIFGFSGKKGFYCISSSSVWNLRFVLQIFTCLFSFSEYLFTTDVWDLHRSWNECTGAHTCTFSDVCKSHLIRLVNRNVF